MSDIAKAVKIAAIQKNMSMNDIATKISITRGGLHQIITGNPTKGNIDRIANALEMKPSELIAFGEA